MNIGRSHQLTSASGPPTHDYRRVATIGLTIIAITFGVLGIWASFAPLGSAVVAPGAVTTESNRQTIQHLEGGIVRSILIHEGDHVQKGQTLFEMDPVQPQATFGITQNQLFTYLARRDRLAAERDNRPAVVFSPEVKAQAATPAVAQAMADEQRQFTERRGTIQSQIAVLNTRIEEYRTEIQGLDTQHAAMEEQVKDVNEELDGLNELYKQDLVPKPRILALERERAQLKGQIGASIADKAKSEKAIGETTLQIHQIQQQFYEQVSKDMSDTQTQVADLQQKFAVVQDQMKRINVVAPMSGVVQNLRVFTSGAVIRPGDPMVEIAPDQGRMIVEARISPNDVDAVHADMKVEVRFSTFHDRSIPVIMGHIKSVSQDRLVDESTHTPYYMAVIEVPQENLPPQLKGKLRAGLPAQVIVPTGSRSAMEYIWQPLFNALHTTMREK
jgi:HlyD family type I secretion membrane fusion protein